MIQAIRAQIEVMQTSNKSYMEIFSSQIDIKVESIQVSSDDAVLTGRIHLRQPVSPYESKGSNQIEIIYVSN